jgi:ABC-type branched-subunit amino acid transport system substrate-binding protein
MATGENTTSLEPQQEDVITLACIFDTTSYRWAPDVIATTVKLINEGWWDVLKPGQRLEYHLQDSNCDATTAARGYWKLRTLNGNQPMDGVFGARCSDASIMLATISGLEGVPQVSPSSNAAKLSDAKEFPFFSRLVAPNNGEGQGKKTKFCLE